MYTLYRFVTASKTGTVASAHSGLLDVDLWPHLNFRKSGQFNAITRDPVVSHRRGVYPSESREGVPRFENRMQEGKAEMP